MAASSFLPGERALGILFTYDGEQTPLQLDLQILDGMDAWHGGQFDDAESFVARVQLPFADGSAGVSYMTSDIDLNAVQAAQSSGASSVNADVFGFHLLYDYANLGFRGEYFDGDWVAHEDGFGVFDADGWFAEVAYTPENSSVTPFYRYDQFNYSGATQTAQDKGAEMELTRHTFGVAYEPWANNRLTLQVEDIDMENADDTTVGVQWQVTYK